MVPTEVFRARGLLESARAGKDVELDGEATVNGRPAYVLRWNEKSGPPHWPTIEMTLWVDKETYAPLRFSDHSYGKAVDGKPFDQTYTENVVEFKTLPDTPENRKLLSSAADDRDGAQRPAAATLDLHRQRDHVEALRGHAVEVGHVLEHRHLRGGEHAVGAEVGRLAAVDARGVDPDGA